MNFIWVLVLNFTVGNQTVVSGWMDHGSCLLAAKEIVNRMSVDEQTDLQLITCEKREDLLVS